MKKGENWVDACAALSVISEPVSVVVGELYNS
jgi:hypothetical protein